MNGRPPSRLLAYLRLFRLPNVFTAMADVLLGFFFTHESWEPVPQLVLLLAASALLYTAGMVLNDVFDLKVDARERPERPLPAGDIPVKFAVFLGYALLLAGCGMGWTASMQSGDVRPGWAASVLVLMVLGYDYFLKRTPLGPLAMGACRFLNVLLGMSLAAGPWQPGHWLVAAGLGLYITGVTWFARTEARESSQLTLSLAVAVMVAGIGLLAWFPSWHHAPWANTSWYILLGLIGTLIVRRALWAVADPTPDRVQIAVKNCILSLVMLDGVVCLAVRGPQFAVIILALLVPTVLLGRWVYST